MFSLQKPSAQTSLHEKLARCKRFGLPGGAALESQSARTLHRCIYLPKPFYGAEDDFGRIHPRQTQSAVQLRRPGETRSLPQYACSQSSALLLLCGPPLARERCGHYARSGFATALRTACGGRRTACRPTALALCPLRKYSFSRPPRCRRREFAARQCALLGDTFGMV